MFNNQNLFSESKKFIFACGFENRISLLPVFNKKSIYFSKNECFIILPFHQEIYYMLNNNPLITLETDEFIENIFNSLTARGLVQRIEITCTNEIKITTIILSWERRKFDISNLTP